MALSPLMTIRFASSSASCSLRFECKSRSVSPAAAVMTARNSVGFISRTDEASSVSEKRLKGKWLVSSVLYISKRRVASEGVKWLDVTFACKDTVGGGTVAQVVMPHGDTRNGTSACEGIRRTA